MDFTVVIMGISKRSKLCDEPLLWWWSLTLEVVLGTSRDRVEQDTDVYLPGFGLRTQWDDDIYNSICNNNYSYI